MKEPIAIHRFAPDVNGAKRWIAIGSFTLQPSEFMKPGFIVVVAWMLAEGVRNPQFPGAAIAGGLFSSVLLMLVLQPDYGQAALLTAVWMTMFFIVGWSWKWIFAAGAAGVTALASGYFFSPHLAKRVDAFLSPEGAETYQVDKALEAIAHGGAIGRGGEGATVKLQLPDAHTDFIFAVAGEEGAADREQVLSAGSRAGRRMPLREHRLGVVAHDLAAVHARRARRVEGEAVGADRVRKLREP